MIQKRLQSLISICSSRQTLQNGCSCSRLKPSSFTSLDGGTLPKNTFCVIYFSSHPPALIMTRGFKKAAESETFQYVKRG